MFLYILIFLELTLITVLHSDAVVSESHSLVKRDETGLLTGNELLSVGRRMCKAVDGIISLMNNPLLQVLGLSDLAMNMPLPIPRWVIDPFGVVSFVRFIKKTILNFANKANLLKLDLGKRSYPQSDIRDFRNPYDNHKSLESNENIAQYNLKPAQQNFTVSRRDVASQRKIILSLHRSIRQANGEIKNLLVKDVVHMFKIPCELIEFTQSIFDNTPLKLIGIGDWPLLLRDIKNELNLMAIPGQIFKAIFKGK